MRIILLYVQFAILTLLTACRQQKNPYTSPEGYDLNNPKKYVMPDALHEISGIAFNNGNSDTLYAEQDEEGKVFYMQLTDKKAAHTKFSKNGDYEDIAICNNYVIMLRSDGTLLTFSFSEMGKPEAGNVREWKNLLQAGEYEGMYADNNSGMLYVICKQCKNENESKTTAGYVLQLTDSGTIQQHGNFTIDVAKMESLTDKKKFRFEPSAMAKHPSSNEWFILSSVNKMLVITDSNWNVLQVHLLNPSLYTQPEGIAFDSNGVLYISNEGGELKNGNLLAIAPGP